MKLKKCIPLFGITMAILTAIPVSASNVNTNNVQNLTQLSSVKESEESTASQSDSDEQFEIQSKDTSGMVYDFKDSKTTGVVTATKTWEDGLSNDERPVPDVSISTKFPNKSSLGYTVTFHGNGLTFSDGRTENEIIVNKSGKVISGQYKVPGNNEFGCWSSVPTSTKKVEVSETGVPSNGSTDMDLYARRKTYVLKEGEEFRKLIPSETTSIIFTDETKPSSATLIDVDADGDNGIVAWIEDTVMKVSSQMNGQKIIAPTNIDRMFLSSKKLTMINFGNLDVSNVWYARSIFSYCTNLESIDLSELNFGEVRYVSNMFENCTKLKKIDLSVLNLENVYELDGMFSDCTNLTEINFGRCFGDGGSSKEITSLSSLFKNCSSLKEVDLTCFNNRIAVPYSTSSMFEGCSSLTNVDLTPIDMSNLHNAYSMFYHCSSFTDINLSGFDTSNVTNMSHMFECCYKLNKLDISSFDTSNVTDMDYMFSTYGNLTVLSIGNKFSFVGSYYGLEEGTWYSSDGTAYTSDGATCTIPNNKADTYTRR